MQIDPGDGRYFVVKGKLWHCSNPALDEQIWQRLVNELMDARRAVKTVKASGDSGELKAARARVQTAKVSQGKRGPVWWDRKAPDLSRHRVMKRRKPLGTEKSALLQNISQVAFDKIQRDSHRLQCLCSIEAG
jgi:hypothetical protein